LISEIDDLPGDLSSSPLSCCTASVESQNWARTQLQNCLSTHTVCSNFGGRHDFMPTRLLDVSSVTRNGLVRMMYPAKKDLKPKYTTLSYCWGGDQAFKLTQETHDELQVGMPCARLQKSIQDAMRITIWLGVEYIWVDSLCIIQDYPEDWNHESKLMCEIYQNSLLTISAQGAKNSSQGCFAFRNPLMHHPCKIEEDDVSGRLLTVLPNNLTGIRRNLAFEDAPLFGRAWAFQERMLSARNIFFGEVLSWQCNELSTCEILEDMDDKHTNPKELLPRKQSIHLVTGVPELTGSISQFWAFLMESYPTSGISVASDRPIAVRGITKYLEDLTGYQNKYGLWFPFLASEMLWQVEKPNVLGTQTRFPTWSWLRMTTPVTNKYSANNYYKFEEKNILCRVSVIDEKLVPPTLPKDASPKITLQIKGFLLAATTFTKETIHFDSFLQCDTVVYIPDKRPRYPKQQVFFLPIARGQRDSLWAPIKLFHFGLAVCESELIKGGYERIGFLKGGFTLDEKNLVEQEIFLI
jgi:hypothetical protein